MYALYLGLLICYQLGVSNLIIESDSKLLVTWCPKNTSPPWELHDLWKKITVMGDYVSYSIAHVYREANKTADSLLQNWGLVEFLILTLDMQNCPKALLVNGP